MHHKCETARFDVAPAPPTAKILNQQCARSQVPISKLEVKIIHCAHLENKFKGEFFSAAIFDF